MYALGEYEQIRQTVKAADVEEPLTASEILELLDDGEFESPHRIATVLGRRAEYGDVTVIRDRPYRYEL
ncbi:MULTISPECIES: hypothetical protein [Natranaeroarchaeum]|uniref:Uncharacterized protein n=2 Tax=Natranaeroarchaeum TaxID=2917705 RepID=A0A897MUF0_9EURY|nr:MULTISPECIES: hypothetical protein [Natranaeroarchaeum]MCL9812485.1 hypothetical protein [Natranaeroarchaeum aerophilus]QSG04142.1 Uncharacterized protein AArcS_2955 [Natranaeroarchaeum sulfidigenes]